MDSYFRFPLFVSISLSTGGFIYTLLSDLKLYKQAIIIKTLIPSGDALDVPFVFLGYLLYGNKTSHIDTCLVRKNDALERVFYR